MAKLGDFHPAFEVPPATGGCCNCTALGGEECGSVFIEARACSGSASDPGNCGFFNPDDELFYLTKTQQWAFNTRDVDPPPHLYECESVFITLPGGSVVPRKVKTVVDTDTIEYTSLEVFSYTWDAEAFICDGPTLTDNDTETYEIIQYINIVHPAGSDCSGTGTGEVGPPGGNLTELDPDTTTPETTYENQFIPVTSSEILSKAMDDHDADCEPEGPWEDFPFSSASLVLDVDGEVDSAIITTCATRFRIIGGNTGYISFDWVITNQDFEEVGSGTVSREWDPSTEFETTVSGPDLTVEWPNYAASETVRTLDIAITEIRCTPP